MSGREREERRICDEESVIREKKMKKMLDVFMGR
jgi:hypothetical protein